MTGEEYRELVEQAGAGDAEAQFAFGYDQEEERHDNTTA